MAAPVLTKVINNGRGYNAFGLNTMRFSAPGTATDQWAATTLIDISAAFPTAHMGKFPVGIKVKKIKTSLTTAGAASVQYLFDKNTDVNIIKHQVIAGGDEREDCFGSQGAADSTSELVCDCIAQWTAKANVTAAQESTIVKGSTGSNSLTIDAAFTTGLIATVDFTAMNIAPYNKMGFWIMSTVAQKPGALALVIDETSACASPSETLPIPALQAGVWTWVETGLFAGATTTRDVLISVGLTAVSDPGECVLYIDTIRALRDPMIAPTTYGDVVVTSVGIASADLITGMVDFEFLWNEDSIRTI